jgi:putative RNA 2'-phosphotransferase
MLDQLVNAPGKRRFEIRGGQIRAAQGHSVPVELQLTPRRPPDRLYHGTTARFLPRILAEGLKPGQRTHVHLSADPVTAAGVGSRRGRPVVLAIDAAAAYQHGHHFYRAANGVWLTGELPPRWIAGQVTT